MLFKLKAYIQNYHKLKKIIKFGTHIAISYICKFWLKNCKFVFFMPGKSLRFFFAPKAPTCPGCFRNGVKIKYPFDTHLLSPYILFLSLNSPAIRLKKQSSGLKISSLK